MSKIVKYLYCLFLSIIISSGSFAQSVKDYQNPEDIFSVSQETDWLNFLHFYGKKSIVVDDAFFLNPDGKNNPENELGALIQEYLHPTYINEEDVVCRFPARINFIKKHFNLPQRKNKTNCVGYNEFRKKVSAQNIYMVFAGENNTSPSSMMGHLFLKLSGSVDGITREHAFSFLATFEEQTSLITYSKILLNIIDGYYMLSPYNQKALEYTEKEQRPLWEIELKLSESEKETLLQHMWELKNKQITYDFISHNCGNATIKILQIAKPGIISKDDKLWTTPLEYVGKVISDNKVEHINLLPSSDYLKKMEHFNSVKNISKANPSSKISIGFQHNRDNYLTLTFRPVYLDLSEPNTLYYDDLETKLFSFELKYNLKNNRVILDKIDVLKMTSIIDFSVDSVLSKHFKLSLENNFDEKKTNLHPTIEFGMGIGIPITQNIQAYILPKLGYRYNDIHNFYLNPEIGSIFTPKDKFKSIISFENYLNTKENNRGYGKKIATSFVYQLNQPYSLELNLNRYFDTDTKNINEIWLKTGFSF